MQWIAQTGKQAQGTIMVVFLDLCNTAPPAALKGRTGSDSYSTRQNAEAAHGDRSMIGS